MPNYWAKFEDGTVVQLDSEQPPSEQDFQAQYNLLKQPQPTQDQKTYDFAVARQKSMQQSGEWQKLDPVQQSLMEPEAPGQSGLAKVGGALGTMSLNLPRMAGVGLGMASKAAAAGVGRLFGTGDTVEDIGKSLVPQVHGETVTPPTPLPVERATQAMPGVSGLASRAGLGLVQSIPKIGLLAAFPESLLAQSIAAGGIFGMDDSGNFHPKSAVIGALMPGASHLVQGWVGSGIAKAMQNGSTILGTKTAQNVMETIGQQAMLDALMVAGDSPELIAEYRQNPETAYKHLADIIGGNLAFALLGTRKFLGLVPTETEQFIMTHADKYAELADKIMTNKLMGKGAYEAVKNAVDTARKDPFGRLIRTREEEPDTASIVDNILKKVQEPEKPAEAPPAPPLVPPPPGGVEPSPSEVEYGTGGEMPSGPGVWPAGQQPRVPLTTGVRNAPYPLTVKASLGGELPRIAPWQDLRTDQGEVRQEPGKAEAVAKEPLITPTGYNPPWHRDLPKEVQPLSKGALSGKELVAQLWNEAERENAEAGTFFGRGYGGNQNMPIRLEDIIQETVDYPSKIKKAVEEAIKREAQPPILAPPESKPPVPPSSGSAAGKNASKYRVIKGESSTRPFEVQVNENGKWGTIPGAYYDTEAEARTALTDIKSKLEPTTQPAPSSGESAGGAKPEVIESKPATYNGRKKVEVHKNFPGKQAGADQVTVEISQRIKGGNTYDVEHTFYKTPEGQKYPSLQRVKIASDLPLRDAKKAAREWLDKVTDVESGGQAVREPTPPPPESAKGPEVAAVPSVTPSEAQAVAKEVSTPEVTKQTKGFDAKAAKAQKKYLLSELDKAIEGASDETPEPGISQPSYKYAFETPEAQGERAKKNAEIYRKNVERIGTIQVEVPGDGTFTLLNSKQSLKEFRERASKFPTTAPKDKSPRLPSAEASTPSPIGSGSKDDIVASLKDHVSRGDDRPILQNFFSNGKETVATDGRRLIVISKGTGGTPKKPIAITPEGKPAEIPKDSKILNWNQVVPVKEGRGVFFKGLDTSRLFTILRQAQEATSDKSQFITVFRNKDGSLGLRSGSGDDIAYEHNVQGDADVMFSADPQFVIDAVNAARRMGNEKVDILGKDDLSAFIIKGKGVETIIMPARLQATEALGPTEPPPAPADKAAVREPWEMTQAEFVKRHREIDAAWQADKSKPSSSTFGKFYGKDYQAYTDAGKYGNAESSLTYEQQKHRSEVRNALEQGKPVPAEVLADYPDLAKPSAKLTASETGGKPLSSVDKLKVGDVLVENADGTGLRLRVDAVDPKGLDTVLTEIGGSGKYSPSEKTLRQQSAEHGRWFLEKAKLTADEAKELKALQKLVDENKKLTTEQRDRRDALLAKSGQAKAEEGTGGMTAGPRELSVGEERATPAESQATLDWMEKKGLLAQFPGLRNEVTTDISGGAQGEYVPGQGAQGFSRFTQWASSETPLHEFFHHVWRFLGNDDVAHVKELRRQALMKVLNDVPNDLAGKLLKGMSSDEFLGSTINPDFYHLANDSEFFTWMMTKKGMDEMSKPEAQGFIAKIVEGLKNLWQGIKDNLGLSAREDAMWRKILAGDYKYRMADGVKFNRELSATPKNIRQYREQKALEDLGKEKDVALRTLGALGDFTKLKLNISDELEVSPGARQHLNLPRHMELVAMASTDTQGIYGYRDAKAAVKDKGPDQRWWVMQNALHAITEDQRGALRRRDKFDRQARLINSEDFQKKLGSRIQARLAQSWAEQKEETVRNVIAQKVGEFEVQMRDYAANDARREQILQDIADAKKLTGYAGEIGQKMNDIVSVVYPNYWESVGRGGELLSKDAGKNFLNMFLEERARSGDPVTSKQDMTLYKLASEIMAINRKLTEQLMMRERLAVEPQLREATDNFQRMIANLLKSDPKEAIMRLVKREGRVSQLAEQARQAFNIINRDVVKELNAYNDLEGAVMVDERMKQSPEWRDLVNEVHADVRDYTGKAMRVPDIILRAPDNVRYEMMKRERAADLRAIETGSTEMGDLFNEFTGKLLKWTPRGNFYDIDLGFTKGSTEQAQFLMNAYLGELNDWLNDPANEKHVDRKYWENQHDFVDSVYNTLSVLNPASSKSAVFKKSWGMKEFFFRQAGIPQAKVAQTAFENWHRAFLVGDQWSKHHTDPLMVAVRKAAKGHGFDTTGTFQKYREEVFNPLEWEYRHGNAVRAGDFLFGIEIKKADIELLKLMGGMGNELITKAKNIGTERVMEKETTVDKWGRDVFALRGAAEFGAEPGTTLPRDFNSKALSLVKNVIQRAGLKREDTAKLKDLLSLPENDRYVMSWFAQRAADFTKVNELEGIFAEIGKKFHEDGRRAFGDLDDIIDWIDNRTDNQLDRIKIEDMVVGGMHDQLAAWNTQFLKSEAERERLSRVVRASHEGPFTKGFERDAGSSYFYDYGFMSGPEVRSFALDVSMYHLQRWERSLASLEEAYNKAMEELRATDEGSARNKLMAENRSLYRSGEDFRDYSMLQMQLAEVRTMRDRLPIWTGQKVAEVEGLNNLFRLIGDSVTSTIGGWATTARVLLGSFVKQGFVFSAVDRFYLSYPKAAVSMVMSALRIGVGGPPTMIARRMGLVKPIEDNLSGWAEEWYRTGHYFDQQYAFGLGFKSPTLDRISNQVTMPFNHGRGYDPKLSTNAAMRTLQKGFWRVIGSTVEPFLEVQRTIFPTLGYAIAYDSVARQMIHSLKVMEAQARRSFDTYEKLGKLGNFDLDNPKSVKNILAPEAVLPHGLLHRTASELNQVREFFRRGTDQALDDAVFRFWSVLAKTPKDQRGNVHLLSSEAKTPEEAADLEARRGSALANVGLYDIHHASPANRPEAMRASILGRALWPISGWPIQSTRQWFALWGRASTDPELRPAMLTAYTAIGILGTLGMFTLLGDTNKRVLGWLKWVIDRRVDPVKHLGQGEDKKEEAAIALSDTVEYITGLGQAIDAVLMAKSNQSSFLEDVFVTQKLKSLTKYVSDVVHTHDPKYGLAQLAMREEGNLRPLLNRTPGQEGLTTQSNIRTVISKYAPPELERVTTGGPAAVPTELSPYRQALANAIYKGNSQDVADASAKFVQKASEMGRPDPDRLLAQTVRSMTPWSSLSGKPTEEQRAEMLARMTPTERQMVLDGETNYLAAAQMAGIGTEMVKGVATGTSSGVMGGIPRGESAATGGGLGAPVSVGIRGYTPSIGLGRARIGGVGRRVGVRARISHPMLSRATSGRQRLVSGRLRVSHPRLASTKPKRMRRPRLYA